MNRKELVAYFRDLEHRHSRKAKTAKWEYLRFRHLGKSQAYHHAANHIQKELDRDLERQRTNDAT